ncbi:hypothetical protein CDL15_Pgr028264 [Punica granatum]|uniref:Plastid lipid-associated protein/fibrillin conserved domain-containing protein n=1 Tax=Punica granatum TaxID=22663 RepID=A0A218WU65_PUNGR|nr:hypothetical protein CDL15_Pgr028264 [Punica granatum]
MEVGIAPSSIPTSHLLHSAPSITIKMVRCSHRLIPLAKTRKYGCSSSWTRQARLVMVAKENAGLVGNEMNAAEGIEPVHMIKSRLYQAVDGINRGIFGVTSAKRSEIEGLVKLLESQNPTPDPTASLDKVAGCWKLLYSTITILGSKRTKLGLRDFISLGDFFQIIDVAKGKAANVIKFNVRGLNMLNGQLTIEASFKIASNSRVDINYDSSTITPDQLMNLFRKNYDILLGIFNPKGWLEITYVDESLRIGRDDKGNIFILERSEDQL